MWHVIRVKCRDCGEEHNIFNEVSDNRLLYSGYRFPCGSYNAVSGAVGWKFDEFKEKIIKKHEGEILSEFITEFICNVDTPQLMTLTFK